MTEKNTMLDTILTVLDDIKANDIKVLDVRKQTTITDYMIIASGRSSRHVKSTAEHVMETLKKEGIPAISSAGLNEGEWALVDFGDCIVHVMLPETRGFYNLEGLWEDTIR